MARPTLGDQHVESEFADPEHRRRKSADARQDDAIGSSHHVLVGRDLGLGADPLQGFLDRAEVAHAVVEDRDPGHLA